MSPLLMHIAVSPHSLVTMFVVFPSLQLSPLYFIDAVVDSVPLLQLIASASYLRLPPTPSFSTWCENCDQ